MRPTEKDKFVATTEKLRSRLTVADGARSLVSSALALLVFSGYAIPLAQAQTSVSTHNTASPTSTAKATITSHTGKGGSNASTLSPDVVAPVSPPPVAPTPSTKHYDPLNPSNSVKTPDVSTSPPLAKTKDAHKTSDDTAKTTVAPSAQHSTTVAPKPGVPAEKSLLKPQVPKEAEPAVAPDLTKRTSADSTSQGAGATAPTGAQGSSNAAPNAIEKYPAIANLEVLTFGETHPGLPISDRLSNLETTVFKETHPTDSLFARTERLQKVLVGNDVPPLYDKPEYRPADLPPYARVTPPAQPQGGWADDASRSAPPTPTAADGPYSYFDEIAMLPENRVVVNNQQLQDYFIEMVNNERRKVGAMPLSVDPVAEKLAGEHAAQLAERAQISHANFKGENPDRRYTLLGGTDAITESLVSLKNTDLRSRKLYRGAAAKLLKVLMSHQDDKEALCSHDTTHVGFAAEWTADKSRLIACAELVSRHAIIHPVPMEAHVDDKIEVKGVMTPPYQFVRVTLAWEGGNSNLASVADESEEALPYFPPLDYVAYQRRSESGGHDKAIMILKGVGIAAAIAGGVFMPPVALAAPLIAVSGGGSGEHKPSSEIPVKGGVKVEGNVFETKVPLSNEGKDGLYYLTVWGSEGQDGKPVAISRRVIYVSGGKVDPAQATSADSDTGEISAQKSSKKEEKSAKKAKKNKTSPPSS